MASQGEPLWKDSRKGRLEEKPPQKHPDRITRIGGANGLKGDLNHYPAGDISVTTPWSLREDYEPPVGFGSRRAPG